MAKALSLDLRRRVADAIEHGLSYRQAAERFGVSASSAIRCRALRRLGETVVPSRKAAIGCRVAPSSTAISSGLFLSRRLTVIAVSELKARLAPLARN